MHHDLLNTQYSERIKLDKLGDYKVSTVLLKNTLTKYGNYETMIMYKEEFLDYQERCDTLGQAHMQHENAITYVMTRDKEQGLYTTLNPSIIDLHNGTYSIASRSGTEDHIVDNTTHPISCDCKGFTYGGKCYHIRDVQEYISVNDKPKDMIRQHEESKEPDSIKKLKGLPDGEYEDEKLMPVLVEADRLDIKIKRLYAMSLSDSIEGLWIPRVDLSVQERKRILKETYDMETTWIKTHRMNHKDIDSMHDSDLFRYNKMMNEVLADGTP